MMKFQNLYHPYHRLYCQIFLRNTLKFLSLFFYLILSYIFFCFFSQQSQSMGANTTQQSLHQDIMPKDWKLVSEINGVSTFQHCISRDLCQLIRVNNITPQQLEIYQARKNYSFVHTPQIYSYKIVDEGIKQKYRKMKTNVNVEVLAETVSFRIEDLNKKEQKSLDEKFFYRKFQQIILGYQYLFNRFGAFAINENQLGWTANFVTKVWINENYAINSGNACNIEHKTEIQMVYELVRCFKKYCWIIDILQGKNFSSGLEQWRRQTAYETVNLSLQRCNNLNQTSYVYIPPVITNKKIQYITSSPKIERKCSYDLTTSFSSVSNQFSSSRPIYTNYQTPRQVSQRNFDSRKVFHQVVHSNYNNMSQENFNPNASSLSQRNNSSDFSLKIIPYGQASRMLMECGKNYDAERMQASAHCSYMNNPPLQTVRPAFLNELEQQQSRINHQRVFTFNQQTSKQLQHQKVYTQNDQVMSGKFSIKFSTSYQSEKQGKNQYKDLEMENQKFRLTQNSMNLSLKNHTISTAYCSRSTFNAKTQIKNHCCEQIIVNRLAQNNREFSQRSQAMSHSGSTAKICEGSLYTDRSSKPKIAFIPQIQQRPIIQNQQQQKQQGKITFNQKIKQRQHERVRKSIEKKINGPKNTRNTKFFDQLKKGCKKQITNCGEEDGIIRKMIQSSSEQQLKKGIFLNNSLTELYKRQSQSSLSSKFTTKLQKITASGQTDFTRSENKKKSYSLHQEQKIIIKPNFGKKINQYCKDDFIEQSQQSQTNSQKLLDRINSHPVFVKDENIKISDHQFNSQQNNFVRVCDKKRVSIITEQSFYKDSKENSNQSHSENLEKDFNALFQSSELNLQASSQYSFEDLRNQVVDLLND